MPELSQLTHDEVRMLGCLIEKQVTTPDYYPLTLNALSTAASQKSNRDPVMHFTDEDVVVALDGLRHKGLAEQVTTAGSRVPKYAHTMPRVLDLDDAELAVLCVAMLRGPQTAGELKGRTARLHPFASPTEAEATVHRLAENEPPLMMTLLVQPGRKEPRHAHLLAGAPEIDTVAPAAVAESATTAVRARQEAIEALSDRVETLESQLAALQAEFKEFRSLLE
ncbi:MAG TPA: DUF480 domain-containing protein [Lentisphaeria bacterium]|nr:DUF480 domain-containing protein [Lentisphaeria bacterium]